MQLSTQRLGKVVLTQVPASNLVCGMSDQHLITGLYGVSGTGRIHRDCSLIIWPQQIDRKLTASGDRSPRPRRDRTNFIRLKMAIVKNGDFDASVGPDHLRNCALVHAESFMQQQFIHR